MLPIAITSNGTVKATLTQNRRVMSRNSGLSSSIATVFGSSAIPQMGQCPGSSRTISGCIGQTYCMRSVACGISGSNAMPQLGHATGFVSRTSGHIGQTYVADGLSDDACGAGEIADAITTGLLAGAPIV